MRLIKTLPIAETLVLGSVVLATTGQLAIKLGLGRGFTLWTRTLFSLPSPFTIGVISGLTIYALGTILWIFAVSRREISYLYPLASINYILVALSGHLVLNEHLMPARIVGIGVMVAGIILLTYNASKETAIPCK